MKRIFFSTVMGVFVGGAGVAQAEDVYTEFQALIGPGVNTESPQPVVLQLAQDHYRKRKVYMGESGAVREKTLLGRSEDRLFYLGDTEANEPWYLEEQARVAMERFFATKEHAKRDQKFKAAVQTRLFHGADINQANKAGRTYLHTAVLNGFSRSVHYLLQNGAHTELKDLSKMSPRALATLIGQKQVVALFKATPPSAELPAKAAQVAAAARKPVEFDDGSDPQDGEFAGFASLDFIDAVDAGPYVPPPPRVLAGFSPQTSTFEGHDIWDGAAFDKSWREEGTLTRSLAGSTDLRLVHPGRSATWLDGGATGWDANNDKTWTLETRIRFNDIPNGFVFWIGTDTQSILLEAYNDRTQDSWGNSFSVMHNNVDYDFHVIRIVHDAEAGKYHVWRDGARLSPPDGAKYDKTGADSRLIFGDYIGRGFGDHFDVTIDYIRYDQTGAFPPADSDQ
ncbi:MAG: ankyrin repeat domain-containing protein [Verrucomicrobiota bacterium]